MHWASEYIGLPWSATGDGPNSFHCWALVRHVQRQRFGRDLPAIPNPDDLLAIARAFRDHPERRRWDLVETPEEGDCVLMRQARYPVHVGVWLGVDGGKVLHVVRDKGVVAQGLDSLAAHGWRIEGFYRFRPENERPISGVAASPPFGPPAASSSLRFDPAGRP